jgi:steroid delta-isomerase-like uncharacterized protein
VLNPLGRESGFALTLGLSNHVDTGLRGIAMSVEYERVWVEALNRGDVSAADESFAADCVVHITGVPDPIRGVAAWKEVVRGFLTAFPDLHFTIDETIVSGNTVAMRWRARGTHTGPLGALPPTGRGMMIDGLVFDHVANDKVVERWEQLDQSVMLQQLGVQ